MYDYHELEPYLEEFMEYGAGFGMLANSFSSLLSIAAYVLTALALYTLANRRGIKHAWLSWVPVLNFWIIGSLSDQYRYLVKGEVKNKRKALLILHIITWVFSVAIVVAIVVVAVSAFTAAANGTAEAALVEIVMGPILVAIGLCLPLAVLSIATAVVRYMAMYDVYTSCTPQNNVVFLVLSILFRVTEPFFLFFIRDKDEGMPPRKQAPVYETAQAPVYETPQTPVYETPQEPWDNKEYL